MEFATVNFNSMCTVSAGLTTDVLLLLLVFAVSLVGK